MPTLARLSKSKITMYADDHRPPHFHVLAHDGAEALVEIAGLRVLAGTLPSTTLLEALAWAGANLPTLNAKWKGLNP